MPLEVRIQELLEKHKHLKRKIIRGAHEIDFKSFAELYDDHAKLLEAFTKLQKAFMTFHKINDNGKYYLRFKELEVEIFDSAEDDHH